MAYRIPKTVWVGAALLVLCAFAVFALPKATTAQSDDRRLITVYDRGNELSFLTDAQTVEAALSEAEIELDARDTVEPARDEELIAQQYDVNIYRARPVTVVDGQIRRKTMTPFQTTRQIAKDVDITLYKEDIATLAPASDFITDGAGLQMTIERATAFRLDLYGRVSTARTQAATVGEMLEQKGITLGEKDRVSVPLETPIKKDLSVRVWREGVQTLSVDEDISYSVELVYDADRPLGYRAVTTKGVPGTRTITYQVEIKDGKEVSRSEIARIDAKDPTKQIETIGIKGLENGLTKSKGAHYWTDSKGVSHRETYYDLPMNVVMQACGQGGYYTVRFDGMKIDRDGYIIIAANYGIYPRCSIVETSAGPAKVYDTGGFAERHPYGFDLATDWTRADGI